jgi:hypothetical protein
MDKKHILECLISGTLEELTVVVCYQTAAKVRAIVSVRKQAALK